jgi:TM2 domain-containing membrane protein YozV
MKDKTTAGVLGIFLGGFGAHKFYLGETGTGIVFLLFCWTLIPSIIGFVQGLNYLGMNQATFDAHYNGRLLPGGYPGNFVVNVSPSIGYLPPPGYGPPPPGYGPPQPGYAALPPGYGPPPPGYGPPPPGYATPPPPGYGPPAGATPQAQAQGLPAPSGSDLAARISALHDLKIAGALTEDEFNAAKQKLLSANRGG